MNVDRPVIPVVVIGHPRSDHVAIRVLGRLHGDADDYWDGNWLVSPIEVVAGCFNGRTDANLRVDELRSFRQGLHRIRASNTGTAELTSMEEWVSLAVTVDEAGSLHISGCVVDQPGVGNELSFHIEDLPRSNLDAIIKSLEDIEVRFPVLGSP